MGFKGRETVGSGGVFYDSDKIIEVIAKQPDVVAGGAIIRGPVLVKHDSRISFAYIKSVPPEGDDTVLPLRRYLKMGEYELRGDSVVVGSKWSKSNSAFPGDTIEIYGPAQLE